MRCLSKRQTYAALRFVFGALADVGRIFVVAVPIVVFIAFMSFVLIHISSLSLRKKRTIALMIGCIVTVPIIIFAMINLDQYVLREIPLKNSSICYIYFDASNRGLYYEIREGNKIVIPKTLFAIDNERKNYHFQAIYAEHKMIIGILDLSEPRPALIAIYDMNTNESWPRLHTHEESDNPQVFKKWMAIYEKLQKENPDIPIPYYFSSFRPTNHSSQ